MARTEQRALTPDLLLPGSEAEAAPTCSAHNEHNKPKPSDPSPPSAPTCLPNCPKTLHFGPNPAPPAMAAGKERRRLQAGCGPRGAAFPNSRRRQGCSGPGRLRAAAPPGSGDEQRFFLGALPPPGLRHRSIALRGAPGPPSPQPPGHLQPPPGVVGLGQPEPGSHARSPEPPRCGSVPLGPLREGSSPRGCSAWGRGGARLGSAWAEVAAEERGGVNFPGRCINKRGA